MVILVWLVESFDIGLAQQNPPTPVLGHLQRDLTSTQVGLLGASATIGLVLGMLPAGRMVDVFGRKKVLIAGTALFSIFTACSAFSPNFTTLVILRVIAGLGEGAIFPVPYLMISELVNKRARGRIMGYAQWVLNCGYTLPALVGLWSVNTFSPDRSWRVPCLIGRSAAAARTGADQVVRRAHDSCSVAPPGKVPTDARREVRALVEKIRTRAGSSPHDESLVDPEYLAVLEASETPRSPYATGGRRGRPTCGAARSPTAR